MNEVDRKLTLLELAQRFGNVSFACQIMGYSRDSFYRFREVYDRGGTAALANTDRQKANLKNRVRDDVEQAVVALSVAHPGWGQARVARVLGERGLVISASGVRSVWKRHGLETSAKRRAIVQFDSSSVLRRFSN
jgi:transposase